MGQRPLAVDRLAQRVDDAAEPAGVREDDGAGAAHLGLAAEPDPVERAERHGERPAAPETDHFRGKAPPIPRQNVAPSAHGKALRHAREFDQHPHHGGDPPVAAVIRKRGDFLAKASQGGGHCPDNGRQRLT